MYFNFQGAEIAIYLFKWTHSRIAYSCTMDKTWFRTSRDYNQYNGVYLEVKGWTTGKNWQAQIK